MSLKLSFFPLHFIVVLLLSFALAIVFNDTIYVYMASNLYLNGLILSLFIVCILWLLGVLSYYSRSLRVFNSLVQKKCIFLKSRKLRSEFCATFSTFSVTAYDFEKQHFITDHQERGRERGRGNSILLLITVTMLLIECQAIYDVIK